MAVKSSDHQCVSPAYKPKTMIVRLFVGRVGIHGHRAGQSQGYHRAANQPWANVEIKKLVPR